jgi:RNA polymerase sigma factor (sigma-70 family)
MPNNPLNNVAQHEWERIIESIVKRYAQFADSDALLAYEDLKQEAWVGLLHSCDRYDPKEGTKFTTFAHDMIRFHLCRFITRRKLEYRPNQVQIEALDVIDAKGYIDNSVENADVLSAILEAVKGEPYVHLLIEHFIKGMSYRALEAKHGMSHANIGNKINALLRRLEKRVSYQNA